MPGRLAILFHFQLPMNSVLGNYIAGEWVGSQRSLVNLNPSDLSDCIGEYAEADDAQVADAVAAATQASLAWASSTPQRRADALDAIGTEILARRVEIGRLLAREEGKQIVEAIGETVRAGYIFKYFAGEALRLSGDLIDSVRPGIDVAVLREPIGVVGLITPWNFPIAIPAWKIAPALAYGNTVVFKPAELTSACAWTLAEIISRCGLPAGTFNLVMGQGARVGEQLVNASQVDAISFTGSQGVGRHVLTATAARGARCQLEMGGKNVQVVLDDADLELAAEVSLQSAFFSTGQRCTAASRLVVVDTVHDRFVEILSEKMRRLRVGHALNESTQIGPVVDAKQLAKNLEYLRIGKDEGATLSVGGDLLTLDTDGHYLQPALFLNSTSTMRINREEIFGPVASVIRVRDYDEALEVTNNTPFGLCAGIATQSLKHARHYQRHAKVGMVMVNLPTAGVDYHVPFGGRKSSSFGPREQGRYASEFYSTTKTSYVNAS